MACNASFPPVFPYDCLTDVLGDITSKKVTMLTAAKIAYAAGCLISLGGGSVPIVGATDNVKEASFDHLVMALQEVCDFHNEHSMVFENGHDNNGSLVTGIGPLGILSVIQVLFQIGSLLGSAPK